MKKSFLFIVIGFMLCGTHSVSALDASSTPDTTAPIITTPPDQSFATTTFPATPLLVPATATDDTDPTPTVTYSPLSFSVGTTSVTWTATDISGNATTTTSLVIITDATPPAETATIAIRNGSTLIGPITITLPSTTSVPVPLSPTGTTTTYTIPARGVLALLSGLDTTSSDFAITDLQYFTSFNSFLINCIATPTTPDCYSWTYAVNGSFPSVGMDTYTVQSGDSVYVFFGSQWQVTATSSALSNESFTVTAELYNPVTGTYAPAPHEVVGAVQFDSNFTAVEFATSTTDSNGIATLLLSATGTYSIGIQQTGYFPNFPISITAPQAPIGGGGTPAGSGPTHTQLDIPSALSFLSSKQQSNGSFGALLYTDWAAIGLKSTGGSLDAIKNYFSATALSDSEFASVTDYERHAMTLLALGINPYSGRNYIAPIVNAFDGVQIGSPSLVNDDIFGVIALTHAGYSQNDDMIKKVATFILSKQQQNGSWENSPDVTGAAMQALGSLFALPGVNAGLGKAVGYLASTQHANGGWGNPDSTAWVMTAINSANEAHPTPESAWTSSGGFYPRDALRADQHSDGGMRSSNEPVDTRVWTTAYALTAASGKSWVTTLYSFSQPTSGGGTPAETTGTATSTATSTSATSTTIIIPLVLGVSTSTEESLAITTATSSATTTTPVKKAPKKIVPKKKHVLSESARAQETPALTVTLPVSQPDPLLVRIKNWFARFLGL